MDGLNKVNHPYSEDGIEHAAVSLADAYKKTHQPLRYSRCPECHTIYFDDTNMAGNKYSPCCNHYVLEWL